MFKAIIRNTPFSESDDSLYNGIPMSCTAYNCFSLGCTLRALLMNRVDKNCEDIPITFTVCSSRLRHVSDDSDLIEKLADDIPFSIGIKDELLICEISSDEDDVWDRISSSFSSHVLDTYDIEFNEVKKVREFFRKSLNVLCFINPVNRTSLVFMEKRGVECYHYIQMAIPTYLPWYFDKETNPITELELKLIKSLKERNAEPYIAVLEEMGIAYNLDEIKMVNSLGNFEKKWAEKALNSTESKIRSIRNEIDRIYARLSEMLAQKRDADIMLNGIKMKINNTETKTLDYFKSNKCLVFESGTDDSIIFYADTFIECFDEAIVESFIENPNSIIYSRSRHDHEDTEKVFKAVFLDQIVKVKVTAKYSLSIGCNEISGISYPDYKAYMKNHLKNPHINHYRCLGDYGRMMMQALENEDVVGALELCCMSARSINFADNPVMEKFIPEFTDNQTSHFILPTGEETNFEGVVKYLETQETEKTEKTEEEI